MISPFIRGPAICYPCQGAPSSTPRFASHEAFSHCDLGALKRSRQPKPTTPLVSSRGEFKQALFTGTLTCFPGLMGREVRKGFSLQHGLYFQKTSLSPKFKASFPESHRKRCSVLAQQPDPWTGCLPISGWPGTGVRKVVLHSSLSTHTYCWSDMILQLELRSPRQMNEKKKNRQTKNI